MGHMLNAFSVSLQRRAGHSLQTQGDILHAQAQHYHHASTPGCSQGPPPPCPVPLSSSVRWRPLLVPAAAATVGLRWPCLWHSTYAPRPAASSGQLAPHGLCPKRSWPPSRRTRVPCRRPWTLGRCAPATAPCRNARTSGGCAGRTAAMSFILMRTAAFLNYPRLPTGHVRHARRRTRHTCKSAAHSPPGPVLQQHSLVKQSWQ